MNKNKVNVDNSQVAHSKNKLIFGLLVFVLSISSPLLIPFVLHMNISVSIKTIISGLLLFGIPEVGMLLAVIILGQEGFSYLKSKLLFWFKQAVAPATVSRKRYRIGIVLFSGVFILSFLTPYISYFFSLSVQQYDYYFIFILDLLFFISLVILGGSFWEKLRALFVYDMNVISSTKIDSREIIN